jgi:SAM-dependent methyltransferase
VEAGPSSGNCELSGRCRGGGAALEFGIGTGRVALPLSQRGVEVHGVDISEDMTAQLRAKPGGQSIGVTVGDSATTAVPGTFSLVYLVFNALSNLLTQAEQVACFQNAARHLLPGGRLVVEMWVPDLRRVPARSDRTPLRRERVARRLRHH